MGKSLLVCSKKISNSTHFLCYINICLNSDNIFSLLSTSYYEALKASSNQNRKIPSPRPDLLTSNSFLVKVLFLNLDSLQQREDGRLRTAVIIITIWACWNIKLTIISVNQTYRRRLSTMFHSYLGTNQFFYLFVFLNEGSLQYTVSCINNSTLLRCKMLDCSICSKLLEV